MNIVYHNVLTISTVCDPVRLFSISALKRLHHNEDLITEEEECRRFGKLSRERRLHAFSLAVDKHKDDVLRMIDLIEGCGLCEIAQRMRGMCFSTSCCISI